MTHTFVCRSPSIEDGEERLRVLRRDSPLFIEDDERIRFSRPVRRRSISVEETRPIRRRRSPSIDREERMRWIPPPATSPIRTVRMPRHSVSPPHRKRRKTTGREDNKRRDNQRRRKEHKTRKRLRRTRSRSPIRYVVEN